MEIGARHSMSEHLIESLRRRSEVRFLSPERGNVLDRLPACHFRSQLNHIAYSNF